MRTGQALGCLIFVMACVGCSVQAGDLAGDSGMTMGHGGPSPGDGEPDESASDGGMPGATCGDGTCGGDEDYASCSADCGTLDENFEDVTRAAIDGCRADCDLQASCYTGPFTEDCKTVCRDTYFRLLDVEAEDVDLQCARALDALYACTSEMSCDEYQETVDMMAMAGPCLSELDDVALQCMDTFAKIPPEVVDVSFEGAVVTPTKQDQTNWDSGSEPYEAALDAYAAFNPGSARLTKALSFFAEHADAFAKPDPFGWSEVNVGSGFGAEMNLADTDTLTEDTFTPLWPGSPTYLDVQLAETTRIRITVRDEDITNHDDIATVVIDSEDLLDAYRSQDVYGVNVYDQGLQQLWFVNLTVTAVPGDSLTRWIPGGFQIL